MVGWRSKRACLTLQLCHRSNSRRETAKKVETDMFRSLLCVTLTAATCLVFASRAPSAEDATNTKPSSDSAAALVVPEFSKHLDIDAATAAFRAEDAEALFAIAEKLSAAERAAGKSNTPLPARTLYRAAVRVAQQSQDQQQLDTLKELIGTAKQLAKDDQLLLLTEISATRKLTGRTRKVDAGPGLRPSETTPEAIVLYHTFVKEIRITQEYGTEEDLELLVGGIKQLRELHLKQRAHLEQVATTALVAIRERGGVDVDFGKLAAVSRSISTGLRIVGPGEAPTNGIVWLAILPTGPAASKPGQLHFRGSTGLQVPEKLEWSGQPLVVPVTIKTTSGKQLFVTAGLTANANSLTWNAQTARE